MADERGSLTLVATPIGNLADLSPRAAEALGAAEFWIVEDTRVSGKLQGHLGIKKPMRVLNDHTNPTQVERYVDELAKGASACLLTDGGSPVISDPGASLCDLAYEKGVSVDAIPGPSAVTDALMLSGFFGQRFAFLGFLGRKPGAMKSLIRPFADSSLTLVFFESPHRLAALLAAVNEELGNRRYAICREMTKMHQQVFRETLPIIPTEAQVPHKGEVTVVVEGRRRGVAESD